MLSICQKNQLWLFFCTFLFCETSPRHPKLGTKSGPPAPACPRLPTGRSHAFVRVGRMALSPFDRTGPERTAVCRLCAVHVDFGRQGPFLRSFPGLLHRRCQGDDPSVRGRGSHLPPATICPIFAYCHSSRDPFDPSGEATGAGRLSTRSRLPLFLHR